MPTLSTPETRAVSAVPYRQITLDVLNYIKARNGVGDMPHTEQIVGRFSDHPRRRILDRLTVLKSLSLVREIKQRDHYPSMWEAK